MVFSMDQIEARARAGFPRSLTMNGRLVTSWDGGCLALVKNLGGFNLNDSMTHALQAAIAMGAASTGSTYPGAKPGSLRQGPPPRGWLGLWAGVWDSTNRWYSGHVAFGQGETSYSPDAILGGSATMARLGVNYGYGIGSCDFDTYNRATGLPYLGCVPAYLGQSIPGTSTAGLGSSPLNNTPPPSPKEPKMFIVAMQSSTYRNGMWLIGTNYLHGFTADQWNTVGGWLQAAGVWVFTPPSDFAFDRLVETLTTDAPEFPFRGDNDRAGASTVAALTAAIKTAVGAPSSGASPSDSQVDAAVKAAFEQLNLTLTLEGKAVPA